jgi:hypothetical protein
MGGFFFTSYIRARKWNSRKSPTPQLPTKTVIIDGIEAYRPVDVARSLGMCISTLYDLLRSGKLAYLVRVWKKTVDIHVSLSVSKTFNALLVERAVSHITHDPRQGP